MPRHESYWQGVTDNITSRLGEKYVVKRSGIRTDVGQLRYGLPISKEYWTCYTSAWRLFKTRRILHHNTLPMLEVSFWKDTSSTDSEVSQVHLARVHVYFQTPYCVWDQRPSNTPPNSCRTSTLILGSHFRGHLLQLARDPHGFQILLFPRRHINSDQGGGARSDSDRESDNGLMLAS